MQRNERKGAAEELKYEVAQELGLELDGEVKPRLTSREAGRIGGHMVRRMIEDYQRQHGN